EDLRGFVPLGAIPRCRSHISLIRFGRFSVAAQLPQRGPNSGQDLGIRVAGISGTKQGERTQVVFGVDPLEPSLVEGARLLFIAALRAQRRRDESGRSQHAAKQDQPGGELPATRVPVNLKRPLGIVSYQKWSERASKQSSGLDHDPSTTIETTG